MNKSFLSSIGTKIGLALAAVATFFQGITCEQLTQWQALIPEDVSNWSLWVSAIITVLLGGYSTKRSAKAHGGIKG